MKNFLALILALMLITTAFAGCTRQAEKQSADQTDAASADEGRSPVLTDCKVIYDTEFGGAYIAIDIDGFNKLGFEYGDSVDISFSNGYHLDGIPYYNGYYTKVGEPLLVAYPGYAYIKVGFNNGDDLWAVGELSEGDAATVTLDQRGRYLDVQQARDIHYKDDRSLFESDEEFANFRSISVSGLKKDTVYRSASPCDNQHNRAAYSDALAANAGIQYIINLADTDEKIEGYMSADDFNSPHFAELYQNGKVLPLAMNMNFGSDEFRQKSAEAMTAIAQNEGPFLIHCTEGKDRTGFICMLLEAFAGAGYQEIVDDYMITYANYYRITQQKEPQKYGIIVKDVLDPMIEAMVGDDSVDITHADLSAAAEDFLKSGGMTDTDISLLKEKLTEQQ